MSIGTALTGTKGSPLYVLEVGRHKLQNKQKLRINKIFQLDKEKLITHSIKFFSAFVGSHET
jgi:hypothetical protein